MKRTGDDGSHPNEWAKLKEEVEEIINFTVNYILFFAAFFFFIPEEIEAAFASSTNNNGKGASTITIHPPRLIESSQNWQTAGAQIPYSRRPLAPSCAVNMKCGAKTN